MKKTAINEESGLITKLLDINKKKLEELSKQESTIQERYKVLMEKELASITRQKAERESAIESLQNLLNITENITEADQPTQTDEAPTQAEPEKKDEEPVIQDTLFPENNEPEQDEQPDTKPEPTQDENENTDSNNEAPREEPEEKAVSEPQEVVFPDDAPQPGDESGFQFGDDEHQAESAPIDDDTWPNMPTEWN